MTKQKWIEMMVLVDDRFVLEANPLNNHAKHGLSTKKVAFIVASLGSIAVILLASIFLSFLIGVPTEPNTLEWGFLYADNAPLPSDFFAYKTDRTEFEIDDVTISIYFGGIFSKNLDDTFNFDRNIPEFDIYFGDAYGEKEYLIRHFNENYVSEKYRCQIIPCEQRNFRIEFAYSEKLSIPKELFDKQSGVISIWVAGVNVNMEMENQKYEIISGVTINYDIVDNKVVLSHWDGYRT